jgi:hypothetical protein
MNGKSIKAGLLYVSLTILGGGMSGCADGASWKEEVLLQDGSRLVVERSVVRKGRHEPFQSPTIGEQSLSFVLPATHQRVRWKDEYSEDLGSANFLPMMLEIDKDTAYLVVLPMGCLSYNKWGRPNPPYVVFKYQGKDWQRVALQALPDKYKTPNLIISSPDDAVKKAGSSLISAEMVSRINNAPVAAGSEQPHLKEIVREPLKPGSVGVSCEELVFYKGAWVSPGDSIGRRMMDRMSK